MYMSEIIATSAPCPAWSLAYAASGLLRSDGMSKVFAIFFAAMLLPGVLFLENVSNLKAHKHWRLIAWAIEWLNYRIQWNQYLDLRDVIPQAFDRTIMLCFDTRDMGILRADSVRGSIIRKHTLRIYGVVGDLELEWTERVKLQDAVQVS